MSQSGIKKSEEMALQPRFENGKAMLIAGFRRHYTSESMNDIPAHWERFASHIGKVPNEIGRVAYGVCSNFAAAPFSFDYLAGVEISAAAGLPKDFIVADIPALRYAVFTHEGHISKIRDTIDAIWKRWLPNSGHAPVTTRPDLPYMIERYGEGYDPKKGMGDTELWIPIQS